MGKVIPIRFNEKNLKQVKELEDLLGIADIHGSFVKTVKFCIALALSTIKHDGFVYFELSEEELQLYFKSKTKIAIHKKKLEELRKAQQGTRFV